MLDPARVDETIRKYGLNELKLAKDYEGKELNREQRASNRAARHQTE